MRSLLHLQPQLSIGQSSAQRIAGFHILHGAQYLTVGVEQNGVAAF